MAKTKKSVKRPKRNTKKKSSGFSLKKLHKYLFLFVILVIASVFALRTLTTHADPLDYSGTSGSIGGNNGGITYPLQNNYSTTHKFTVTLSYSGLSPGSASLSIYGDGGSLLTESSYGNPITLQVNVPAFTTWYTQVYSSYLLNPTDDQGSYTLSISAVATNDASTNTAFRSMPCDYTPVVSAYTQPVAPCSSSSPAPTPTPPPAPTPTPTPTKDTTPPTVPTNLQLKVGGPNDIDLTWTASADAGSSVAGYHIYRGTTASSLALLATVTSTSYSDESVRASTAYYYYVTAYDKSGNVSEPSNTAMATSADVPPILPTIGISNPKDGDTLSGIIDVNGVAGSSAAAIKSIQVEVDGNGFVTASSYVINSTNEGYDYKINTRLYADTTHTITAKVVNSAGASNTALIKVTFKNGTYSAAPPLGQGTWVSPEGMTVVVNSKGKNPHTGQPWTIADAYYMVKACAVGTGDFGTIAPYYTVEILDDVGNLTGADDYTSAGVGTGGDGNWSNFTAASYLHGSQGAMLTEPYDVVCYEYGHAWTEYYYYIVNYPATGSDLHNSGITDPPKYLNERWVSKDGTTTLAQDNKCQYSTDGWDGCITDDRRILFGGPGTNGGDDSADRVPGEPNTGYKEPYVGYINSGIVLPQNQAGLADWYMMHWITGQ